MKHFIAKLLAGTFVLLSPAAEAATLLAVAEAEITTVADSQTVGPVNSETASDGITARAEVLEDDQSALAAAFSIPEFRSHRVAAVARAPVNRPDLYAVSSGSVEEEYRYVAETAGLLTLRYVLEATHIIQTDLAPIQDLFRYSVFGSLKNETGAAAFVYNTHGDPDPLLGLPTASVTRNFGATLFVDAGEEFSIGFNISGGVGQTDPFGAFFAGDLYVDGFWSLDSTGDFRPVPDDLGTTAPVPLPASLPLLALGLLSFRMFRKR